MNRNARSLVVTLVTMASLLLVAGPTSLCDQRGEGQNPQPQDSELAGVRDSSGWAVYAASNSPAESIRATSAVTATIYLPLAVAAPRGWTLTAPLHSDHGYGATATLLPGGSVLLVGGNIPQSDVAELYDPATGTWSLTGSLGTSRSGHTATLLASGKVLVAGGERQVAGSWQTLHSAELYDPATGTWTPTSLTLMSFSLVISSECTRSNPRTPPPAPQHCILLRYCTASAPSASTSSSIHMGFSVSPKWRSFFGFIRWQP